MNISFRSIDHADHETKMGHPIWFYPVAHCDGVSATANTNGFTPLRAIERQFGWDRSAVDEAASLCNAISEVCVVPFSPKLLLVPATKGQGNAEFLIHDLVAASKAAGVRALHFTHFGFIQGRLPAKEIAEIFSCLFGNVATLGLECIVIDIDVNRPGN